jgi:glutamate carboxypeptidase
MRIRIVLASLAAALAAASLSAQPKLNPVERRMMEYVDAHQAEAEVLLERVVNVNSGTMNFEGVREVGKIFRAEFDKIGFKTTWVDGAAFHRAGHLVAEHAGPGPKVLLIGHLDTVFEKDSPFQKFERLPGGKVKGPGTTDMKGGDVIILQAMKALAAAGALSKANVTVILMGDEEKVGEPQALAREALFEAARGTEAAIGYEDGDGAIGHAATARRGSADWHLVVTGRAAHSSQIFRPENGAGAIFELSRILNGFYRDLSGEKLLTFSPGIVVGGTAAELDSREARATAFGKSNVIAEKAAAQGDIRTISPEQLERTRKHMREIVAAHLPVTQAEISFDEGYPPMAPTEGNGRLLALFDAASRDAGLPAMSASNPADLGAADVSFVAGRVKMALDGMGLKGEGGHTPRETADLSTLPIQAKRTAIVIYRMSKR